MKDSELKYNIGELKKTASPRAISEQNKAENSDDIVFRSKQIKASMIKLILMGTIIISLIIYTSIAWFASNPLVNTSGTQMKSTGRNFDITMLGGSQIGRWYDPYHKQIKSSSTLVWEITEDYNMGNFDSSPENKGISPGSSGKISFCVSPKIDVVNLDFNFELIGYRYNDTDKKMNAITSSSEDAIDKAIANYLNGHILLFENYKEITKAVIDENTGETKEIGTGEYAYSGLIASDADMKRVLRNQEFNKSVGAKQVTIYWVWPETLSKLVDVTDCHIMAVTQTPFIKEENDSKNTRNVILGNIQDYPQYYLKDAVKNVSENGAVSYTIKGNSVSSLTQAELTEKYDVYGDLYNQVDTDIGMNVNYVLLRMSVNEISNPT